VAETTPDQRQKLTKFALSCALVGGIAWVGAGYLRRPATLEFESPKQAPAPLVGSAAPASAPPEIQVHVLGAVERAGVYKFAPNARVDDAIRAAGGAKPNADPGQLNLAAPLQDGSQLFVPVKAAAPPKVASRPPRREIEGNLAPMPLEVTPLMAKPKDERVASAYASPERPTYASSEPPVPPPSAAPSSPSEPAKKSSGWTKKEAPTSVIDINRADAVELQKLPGIGPATAAKILDFRRTNGPFRTVDQLLDVSGIGPKKLEAMRKWVRV
jgi:competence protein ComEA